MCNASLKVATELHWKSLVNVKTCIDGRMMMKKVVNETREELKMWEGEWLYGV